MLVTFPRTLRRALYWYGSGDGVWSPLPEELCAELEAAKKYRDHLPILGEVDGKKVKIASFEVMQEVDACSWFRGTD